MLPWVKIGGHPAVFVDIERRELYLLGGTYNAQDTWLLFFLLTGVGFALVFATALAGRVWCGWACPQTVFLEGVYRGIERWIEGTREKRMRRNAGRWSMERIARKTVTHALYIVASFFVAHIVLSYFASLPKTFAMVRHSPSAPQAFVWAFAMTAGFYLNFAWFREQLCVVLCPYGRLQSALLDEHSLVVGCDARRGEPRGKRAPRAPGIASTANAASSSAPRASTSDMASRWSAWRVRHASMRATRSWTSSAVLVVLSDTTRRTGSPESRVASFGRASFSTPHSSRPAWRRPSIAISK